MSPDEFREALWHIEELLTYEHDVGHAHSRSGIWDPDNIRSGKANEPCVETCAVFEDARQFLASVGAA